MHGRFDTVTPYFACKRLLLQSNLDASVAVRISEKLYDGGLMFYSWPEVKKRFSDGIKAFVLDA